MKKDKLNNLLDDINNENKDATLKQKSVTKHGMFSCLSQSIRQHLVGKSETKVSRHTFVTNQI